MGDALLVRRTERLDQRPGDLQEGVETHAASDDLLVERLALDALHGEKAHPVGLFD